jgi:hypothetical protein
MPRGCYDRAAAQGRAGDWNMKHLSILTTGALLLSLAQPSAAREASGKFKGAIGGGLMGAEVVLLTESAFRLKSGWAYLAGGVGGAAAGTLGGCYLIEKDHGPRGPIYLFASSLALVIPTMLAVLTASQYEPPQTYRQELPADDEPPIEPVLDVEGAALRPALGAPRAPQVPGVDLGATGVSLGLPTLGVAQSFSDEELAAFGVEQRMELHLSVFNGVF